MNKWITVTNNLYYYEINILFIFLMISMLQYTSFYGNYLDLKI